MMKKHTVSALLILCLLLSCFAFAACSPAADTEKDDAPAAKTMVNIGALKGPTGMGLAPLMAADEAMTAVNDYSFTIAGAPDQLIGALTAGDLDLAALPTNAIALLNQKTEGGVQIIAVNTLGVLYIMAKDDSIQTLADLEGKTIAASGQGSTAEYVLNKLLAEAGLTVGEDVTVDYNAEHSEVATLAQAGEYDVVLLPEPFVTSLSAQDAGFAVALDLTALWEESVGSLLPMGGIAVRSEFLAQNPAAVQAFLEEYATAVETCNSDPAATAQQIEQFDILTAAVAEQAIPRCNIVCLTGEDMKAALTDFYTVLLAADPQSIGGAMPADGFYVTTIE